MNKFLEEAFKEAKKGFEKKDGGPFGAVIVCKGKIVAKAHNKVLKSDATAHAEIEAIRKASKKLKTYDLKNCEIYTTCEPCPMCYSAIYWARIKKVYFSQTRKDAKKIGFDDEKLYDIIKGKRKGLNMKKLPSKEIEELFLKFKKSNLKRY
jgi:guanine deaminase